MQKAVLFWLLLCVSYAAAASFPRLYGEIGDPIFAASQGYGIMLRQGVFDEVEGYHDFIEESEALRKQGLRLDKQSGIEERRAYIAALRSAAGEMRRLEASTHQRLLALAWGKAYERLALLQNNPYPFVREHPAVREALLALKQQNGGVVMYELDTAEQLRVSLESLKARLMHARESNDSEASCLNDMTAINYWMLEARLAQQDSNACRGLESCRQIEAFVTAASHHCTEKTPLYLLLLESSNVYRKRLKEDFYETCR